MKQLIALLAVILVGGLLLAYVPTALNAAPPAGGVPLTGGQSHSIMGEPTISAAHIDQVLAHADSPMQGAGALFVRYGVASGIDPAYVLALFHHESSYGTTGEARRSKSPGNLRCLDQVNFGDLHPWCQNGYAWFPSWQNGLHALYRLLSGSLYKGAGLVTIERILPRYAPPGDHNNDSAYIASVLADVSTWRANA